MLAYLFVVLAVIARLAIANSTQQHFWHLTPVGAALLFFGAKRPVREWLAPLAIFTALDCYLTLGFYHYHLGPEQIVTSLWYAAAMGIGYMLVRNVSPARVVGASLASAAGFFLVSNFAVWAFGTMYSHDLAGLIKCYDMAIPFFRGTFISDLVYTPVFFAVPYLLAMTQGKPAYASQR